MSTITITVDDETEKKFRDEIKEHIGSGKGTLGRAVTEAMQLWIERQTQHDLASELKQILAKGYPMGRLLYKKREELYDRE